MHPRYVHRHQFRVVMGEVDVAQIHFTMLFSWMDRGLSEFLAEIGRPFTRLLEEGPGIPIVDAHISIRERIHLDDILTIDTWAFRVGNTSFRTRHRFVRHGAAVADGTLVHVCVDRQTRATLPVPDWVRAVAAEEDWEPELP